MTLTLHVTLGAREGLGEAWKRGCCKLSPRLCRKQVHLHDYCETNDTPGNVLSTSFLQRNRSESRGLRQFSATGTFPS